MTLAKMRHGAERMDERCVLGEISIEGPPLLVGRPLAQRPDNGPDFVLCDAKSRLINMYILQITKQLCAIDERKLGRETAYLGSPSC